MNSAIRDSQFEIGSPFALCSLHTAVIQRGTMPERVSWSRHLSPAPRLDVQAIFE